MSEDAPAPDAEPEEVPAKVEEIPNEHPVKPTESHSKGPAIGDMPDVPSGENLSPADSNKIIQLTLDILQMCQKKVDDQKISSHSLSFMLLRVKESLDAYFNDYIPKLNTFLYHADAITADYYSTMCCMLPQYGDYVEAIKAAEGDTVDVAGWITPVPKGELLDLVQNVVNNFHSGAMFVRTGRAVYRDINSNMPERRDMVVKTVKHIPDWLRLQDNITRGLEDIREQTFKISAYVDFLKQGESKMAPTLDLSALTQSTNLGDTSKYYSPNETNNQTQ